MHRRHKAGVRDTFRCRDVERADPQPIQAFALRLGRDAGHQAAKESFAPMRRVGGAVPDVGGIMFWRDLELQLADPFCSGRQPTESDDLVAKPRHETPASSRHPRIGDVAVDLHYGRDHRRRTFGDFADPKAGLDLPVRRGGQYPERRTDQKEKKRWRTL